MKTKPILATLAGTAIIATSVPIASAATTPQMTKAKIVLNGSTFSDPYKFVGGDPQTTYMPIYYVQQLINQALSISANDDAWNGNTHTWSLTVTGKTPSVISHGSGSAIVLNGTTIEDAPTIAAVDPSSGQETTFMPIWYVQQLLNEVLGIPSSADVWDGSGSIPTWTLTTSVKGETQTAMANEMWQVFEGVTWDVNSHPSISDVGISPTSDAVTANDVATWLADWATKAKGYTLKHQVMAGKNGTTAAGTFIPFSLKYESSTDPYTWASEAALFQGTSVTSPTSVVSTSDASTILSNLKWWLTGDREVNGVHHLHVPMYGNFVSYEGGVASGLLSLQQYQAALAQGEEYYDKVTATTSSGGKTVSFTLPDVTDTSQLLVWNLTDGNTKKGYIQGGTSRVGDTGGVTWTFDNNNPWGPSIVINALADHLAGWDIGYPNQNGAPNFSEPEDGGNEQG